MKRILVVDDDDMMLGFVSNALSSPEYEVTCVKDGKQSIDVLKEGGFDLVILDFYMPEADGFDVLANMHKGKDETPVIVFSSKIDAHYEAAVQMFKNMRTVIRKPCPADELRETVKEVLGS